jgi:L-fuconolactonase
MFGSDWPVSTLRADYVDVVTVMNDLLVGCSEAETAAIFGSSAANWYRLDGRR